MARKRQAVDLEVDEWQGCYDDTWKGLIVEDAFTHPAKFAPGLIKRIVSHLMEEGYVERGDLVFDPFGGVGCGGIICAYKGLRWVGVELEEKFVGLANQNFALHEKTWQRSQLPSPIIHQGDSRVWWNGAGNDVIISSPPYTSELVLKIDKTSSPENKIKRLRKEGKYKEADNIIRKLGKGKGSNFRMQGYGETKGNLGSMTSGDIDSVISSPPYANEITGTNDEKETAKESLSKRKSKGGSAGRSTRHYGYGQTKGNISGLKEGDVGSVISTGNDDIISSPPFMKAQDGGGINKKKVVTSKTGKSHKLGNDGYNKDQQGSSEGQLANESDDTFWQAAKDIVLNCFRMLKPGGVACWVTKDFVRNKERVPFSDDWLKLLIACGFVPICRHKAMLVKGTKTSLDGTTTHKKERKSFFRRLAERKGSPRIDHEDVICVKKP